MNEITETSKIVRSEEYKAKNREISLRRYYKKIDKEYKPNKLLTVEEKEERAYQSYLNNKERALARYYRLKEKQGIPPKEEKELTEEQKKAKEYFKKYYQEHKDKYINLKETKKKIFKTKSLDSNNGTISE
jgi:hypothetical protein